MWIGVFSVKTKTEENTFILFLVKNYVLEYIYFISERQKSLNMNDSILVFWDNFQNGEGIQMFVNMYYSEWPGHGNNPSVL